MSDRFYTVDEIAEFVHVRPITIRRQIASGLLACVRIGSRLRIQAEELERWLKDSQRLPAVRRDRPDSSQGRPTVPRRPRRPADRGRDRR